MKERMGGKQSVESGGHPSSAASPSGLPINNYNGAQSSAHGSRHHHANGSSSSRRLTYVGDGSSGSSRLERAHSTMESNGLRIPHHRHRSETLGQAQNNDSSSSSSEEESRSSRMLNWLQRRSHPNISQSLPHYFYKKDAVCAMCGKLIPAEDVEVHFVMCITKPRVSYNEDVLSVDSGECAICLVDMEEGDAIARLPCLCIYHKGCIEAWFKKNQTCPKHPPD